MHAAIENNTLMMETFTGKPVSRYAVVTTRDILVPILKLLIGNLPFMTEQARIMLQYKLLPTLLFDWRPCSQCFQLQLGWGDERPRELSLFDWLLPIENKRLVPQKRHRHRVGGEAKKRKFGLWRSAKKCEEDNFVILVFGNLSHISLFDSKIWILMLPRRAFPWK